MKPARVTLNGKRYLVNQHGVVAELCGGDFMSGYNIVGFADSATTNAVLAEVKRLRHNKARRSRDQAMRDLGMVKVRGALGGTYWE